MAKSSKLSLAQWIFLLLVIWISCYAAGVMTRNRLNQSPANVPEKPSEASSSIEWLPPVDEIRERPERVDLAELENYRGHTIPEIIIDLRGGDSESPGAHEEEELRFGEVKSGIDDFPVFRDRRGEAGLELGAENLIDLSSNLGTFDLDGDGYPDIQTSARPGILDLQLYRNRVDGQFEGVSEPLVGGPIPTGHQVAAADFDNDGDLDLLVVRKERLPNSLLENQGGGKFVDITEAAGILDFRWTASAAWVDFDRDGWIDLFVAQNPEDIGRGSPSCRLFHNEGDGTFRDFAWETGLRFSAWVRDCAWGDFDRDGFPDLALSTFEGPASEKETSDASRQETASLLLLRSVPAERLENWRFSLASQGAGLGAVEDTGRIAFRDYDQDGAIDLLTGGGTWEPFRLFRNRGQGQFEEVTKEVGIGEIAGVLALELADLDGDGFGDLVLGTADPAANRVFLNRGGDSFREVTEAGGIGILQSTPALAAADFDADGDLDLLAAADWTSGAIFENPGSETHGWLTLELEGSTVNRAAVGARISLVVRDRDWILHRIERTARGTQVEIGLGEVASIESLEIEWPIVGWPRSKFSEVPLNRYIRIREGEPKFEVIDRKPFRFGDDEPAENDESGES